MLCVHKTQYYSLPKIRRLMYCNKNNLSKKSFHSTFPSTCAYKRNGWWNQINYGQGSIIFTNRAAAWSGHAFVQLLVVVVLLLQASGFFLLFYLCHHDIVTKFCLDELLFDFLLKFWIYCFDFLLFCIEFCSIIYLNYFSIFYFFTTLLRGWYRTFLELFV